MDNPLLDFTALPRFADVRPDHITPAVDQVLANARAVVAAVTQPDTPVSWDALMAPLADAEMTELAELDVDDFLSGTVFAGAPIVPVSSKTGAGIDGLLAVLDEQVAVSSPHDWQRNSSRSRICSRFLCQRGSFSFWMYSPAITAAPPSTAAPRPVPASRR